MKVLVTGVTGFIGTGLSRALSEAGHTVTGLSRHPDSAQLRLPWLERAFSWQPTSSLPPADAFLGVDAVINLLGERISVRPTAAKKRAVLESRALGTYNLVRGLTAADPRPRVLISASAIGYYGDQGDDEVGEDAPPDAAFLSQVCQAWEAEAVAARELVMRVVVLRVGLVLGLGGPLKPLFLAARLGLGGPLGSGRQWWPWIHFDDVIGLAMHALEGDIEGAVNATAPHPVRQREFARVLGRLLRRPALVPAPALALRLALGVMAPEVLSSRRVIPRRALESGYEFRFSELEPALRDILSLPNRP